MLAVEPVGLDSAEEELGAVGAGPSVGHGQNARACTAEREGGREAEREKERGGERSAAGHHAGALARTLRTGVLEGEVLVSELLAVDGLAAGAVAAGEVAALAHELRDDAVEGGALEVERLARLADALLAGAERAEVLWLQGFKRTSLSVQTFAREPNSVEGS